MSCSLPVSGDRLLSRVGGLASCRACAVYCIKRSGWPGREARCPAVCSCWAGQSLELGGLFSLRPGQAQRSWNLLIRLMSGTRNELTACGSSQTAGGLHNPLVQGVDSALKGQSPAIDMVQKCFQMSPPRRQTLGLHPGDLGCSPQLHATC